MDELRAPAVKAASLEAGGTSSTAAASSSTGASSSRAASSSSAPPTAAPKNKAKCKVKDFEGAEAKKSLSHQKVNEERKAAKNTLHYVAQCKNDAEHKMLVRLACHVSGSEAAAHSDYTANVLSPPEQMQFMAAMANSEYMDDLQKILARCFDVVGLKHIGFDCDTSKALRLSVGDPLLVTEDTMAYRYMAFVLSLLKHRASSLAWHNVGFPGSTARMVHTDPEVAQRGLDRLKLCVEACCWAEASCLEGAILARRCPLGGAIMQRAIALAEQNQFSSISADLRDLLVYLWSGALQTVVIERANQRLRDAETRDASSKVLERLSRWSILRRSDLVEHYGGADVPHRPHQSLPADAEMDALFRPRGDSCPLDLRGITREQNWVTFNSQSVKKTFAEMELMIAAYQAGRPEMFGEGWKTALLPEKQVVILRPPGETARVAFLTICNLQSACICLRLRRHENLVEVVHSLTEQITLSWRQISDLDAVHILPCEAGSPLSALVLRKTCATVPIGVQLRVVGKPIHLVKWHSERGFAGVPEFAMKQLHRHLGYPEPGVAPPGVTMADHLACSLVLAATPKLTKAGLQAILQCRRMYDEQVAIEDDSELTQNSTLR